MLGYLFQERATEENRDPSADWFNTLAFKLELARFFFWATQRAASSPFCFSFQIGGLKHRWLGPPQVPIAPLPGDRPLSLGPRKAGKGTWTTEREAKERTKGKHPKPKKPGWCSLRCPNKKKKPPNQGGVQHFRSNPAGCVQEWLGFQGSGRGAF